MDIRVIGILFLELLFAFFLLYRSNVLDSSGRLVTAIVLLLAAFSIRGFCLDYKTLDYSDFLSKWVDFYRSNGGFKVFHYTLGNYNIPYLYFLCIFSYSSIDDLYLIKLLSIFFDVLLAYSSMLLLSKLGKSKNLRLACFFCVLFLPTVILNGSLWAQCDSIYSSLAVLAIYLALDERPTASMLCFTLSFGFKLQAVFVLPIVAVLLFVGKFKLRHLMLFPVFYAILVLPAVLLGKPFIETLLLYTDQTGSIGSGLNYNSSSIFGFFTHGGPLSYLIRDEASASRIAIVAAFIYMFVLLIVCFIYRKRLDNKLIFIVSVLFALGIPYILPHMHDRYFFLADAMTVILGFAFASVSVTALLTQFASLLGYHAYLKMRYLLLMYNGSIALMLALLTSLGLFIRKLHDNRAIGTIRK